MPNIFNGIMARNEGQFPIDEIPDLKIPIGFENSYRNSYKI